VFSADNGFFLESHEDISSSDAAKNLIIPKTVWLFIKIEALLPCSKQPIYGPYPEPV
jgi:hypothetical protein